LQTESPYEYLIIDGASTDDTIEIAQKYKEEFQKKRIKYHILSEKDDGIYDAMNKGIAKATGDFIAFLNSDDWYEPDAIQTVLKNYEEHPFDMAYGSIRYVGKKGAILIKNSRKDRLVSSRNWNHPSTFAKKVLYAENPFDKDLKIYSDFEWFIKMRKRHLLIHILPKGKPITNFTIGGTSTGNTFQSMLKRSKEKYKAYRKNGYGRIYFLETYLWEFMKYCFMKMNT